MATPGYYKTNLHALTIRELVRLRGLHKLPLTYIVSRLLTRSKGGTWMPSLSSDTACLKEELSDQFWQATAFQRRAFDRLGFVECSLSKIKRHVNPMYLDAGAITYLHTGRSHIGMLIYGRFRVPQRIDKVREHLSISFTAALEGGSLTFTNTREQFDPLPGRERVLVRSKDPAFIYEQFLAHLQRRAQTVRVFSDCNSALRWIDERSLEAFESHVARGLYAKMSEEEVEEARRSVDGRQHKTVATTRVFWAIVFIASIAILLVHSRSSAGNGTIPYHGERFRMSKRYASYEDYKDDPHNLDTNDLDRIEHAITTAPIPSSFSTEKEFWHALFQLKFPGYGFGGHGGFPQSDGSTCSLYSVEIPMRNKERYILGRTSGGKVDVLDDFVFSSESNQIAQVKILGTNLLYLDSQGAVVREKPL
jgi:hypothetical protein